MRVLGIETSCDETGLAIYDTAAGLIADVLFSQVELHAPFGGVVPELASRDHIRKLVPLTQAVIQKAGIKLQDLSGIAYTKGPGLIGALLVGAMFGRSLGFSLGIPTVGVHHLEGHLLAPFLESPAPTFPFLALLVSGGHTALVQVKALGQYQILGETLDDAAGEAFDKTAKLLGLGYPGGAALAALAQKGIVSHIRFPRPMLDRPGLDFSFSGLKTAVLHEIKKEDLTASRSANIAYAFEEAMVDTLVTKCQRAIKATGLNTLVVAGGVGANQRLREVLSAYAKQAGVDIFFPRLAFCTDNGAMIAFTGAQYLEQGLSEPLGVRAFARWPLGQTPC